MARYPAGRLMKPTSGLKSSPMWATRALALKTFVWYATRALRARSSPVRPGVELLAAHRSLVHACPTPRRPSTAKVRLTLFPSFVAIRCTAITPKRERDPTSRMARPTENDWPLAIPSGESVTICRSPSVVPPTRPVRRPPPRIGSGIPAAEMPMRRVKKRSTACGVPAEKTPAFSRKNGRFSGKKIGKRVRLTRWSSTSTCAKSVFAVRSSVSAGVTPYLISPPISVGVVVAPTPLV